MPSPQMVELRRAAEYIVATFSYESKISFDQNVNKLMRELNSRFSNPTLRAQVEYTAGLDIDPFLLKSIGKRFAKKKIGKRSKWVPIPGVAVGQELNSNTGVSVAVKGGVEWLGWGGAVGIEWEPWFNFSMPVEGKKEIADVTLPSGKKGTVTLGVVEKNSSIVLSIKGEAPVWVADGSVGVSLAFYDFAELFSTKVEDSYKSLFKAANNNRDPTAVEVAAAKKRYVDFMNDDYSGVVDFGTGARFSKLSTLFTHLEVYVPKLSVDQTPILVLNENQGSGQSAGSHTQYVTAKKEAGGLMIVTFQDVYTGSMQPDGAFLTTTRIERDYLVFRNVKTGKFSVLDSRGFKLDIGSSDYRKVTHYTDPRDLDGDVTAGLPVSYSPESARDNAKFKAAFENCFAAGTAILMADQSRKPIEAIVGGDAVMAFTAEGQLTPRKVLRTFQSSGRKLVRLNGATLVTDEHPFLTSEGTFTPLREVVEQGLKLIDAEGGSVEAVIEPVDGEFAVYNFEVEGCHTYIADGYRVHNISALLNVPEQYADSVFGYTKIGHDEVAEYYTESGVGRVVAVDLDGRPGADFIFREERSADGSLIRSRKKYGNGANGQEERIELGSSAISLVGETLGSAVGGYLGGSNKFAGVFYSSALGEIGERLGDVIRTVGATTSLGAKVDLAGSIEWATQDGLASFGQQVAQRFATSAAGSISSYLSIELGEALGLEGFGAELFNTVAGAAITPTVNNALATVLNNVGSGTDLFSNLGSTLEKGGSVGGLVQSSIMAFVATKLGSLIVQPHTTAGAVLGSVGTAIGGWIAAGAFASTVSSAALAASAATLAMTSAAATAAIVGTSAAAAASVAATATAATAASAAASASVWGNVIMPGVGMVIGFVLATMIGNLFGKKKPKVPSASAETVLQIPYARYELGAVTVTNNGNRELVTSMATTARDALNGLIAMVAYTNTTAYVSNLNGASTTQAYGHDKNLATGQNEIYATINGVKRYFSSADQAFEFGTLTAIRNTKIVGGDIFAKRALSSSPAVTVTALLGDLQTSEDYRSYLTDREFINAKFAEPFVSAFSETELAALSSNELHIIRIWQLSSGSSVSIQALDTGVSLGLISAEDRAWYQTTTDRALIDQTIFPRLASVVSEQLDSIEAAFFTANAVLLKRLWSFKIPDIGASSVTATLNKLIASGHISSTERDVYLANRGVADSVISKFNWSRTSYLTKAETSEYEAHKSFLIWAWKEGLAKLPTEGERSARVNSALAAGKITSADAAWHQAGPSRTLWYVSRMATSQFAAGWIVTLERIHELGLDKWAASDFYGGLQGFLSSFDLKGHGVGYEDIEFGASLSGAVVSIKTPQWPLSFGASFKATSQLGISNGATTQDAYPRFMADVNGDGRSDLVACGLNTVLVALGQADGTLGAAIAASSDISYTAGWTSNNTFPRTADDVNGDGRADLVGFASDGVYVSLGQPNGTFGTKFKAIASFDTGSGWSSQDLVPRFLGDVNGDGRADIIGVGTAEIRVALGQANGTFGAAFTATTQFALGGAWSSQNRDPRMAGDVNGDGRDDLVGFGEDGVWVALGQGNGTFATAYKASDNFGYTFAAGNWTSFNSYPRLLADVNGDGRADILAYGDGAVYASLAQQDGTFTGYQGWLTPFVVGQGWGAQATQPRMVGDVNGDGVIDLIAAGTDGVYVQKGQPGSSYAQWGQLDQSKTAHLFSILASASTDGRSVSIDALANIGYALRAPGQTTSGNDFVDQKVASGAVTVDDTGGGDDILLSGYGADHLYGRGGWDWLDGGAGDDYLDGGDQNDVLLGGAGRDKLMGGGGDDYLAGGDGDDYVIGWTTADAGLFGGAGNDTLVGGGGSDSLFGEDGDDTFIIDPDGGGTMDWIDGGAGSDTLSFERLTGGVGVDMTWTASRSDAPDAKTIYGDIYRNIENLTGTDYNDHFIGDDNANILKGGAGNDILAGRMGDDILEGGAGADELAGFEGADTASYEGSSAGVYVNLTTGEAFGGDADGDTFASVENLRGSKLADQLRGDEGNNRLEGLAGDDWLVATSGTDFYDGGEGKDFVDYSEATSYVGLNLGGYTATSVTNGVGYVGLAGYHTFRNVEGVIGSAFDDFLWADDGDQTFVGGAGNDSLSGNAGADTYVMNRGDGYDTITEDNTGWNVLSFGENVKFSDLWLGTAGGAGGWLDVGVRGDNAQFHVAGNFANLDSSKIKTLDLNGAGQLDVEGIEYGPAASDNSEAINGWANRRDLIVAYNGDDTISGSGGVWEDKGNVVIGGLGDDVITTSGGDDQFAYDRGDGLDTITDAGGEDTLVFGSTVAAEDVIYEVVGGDLYIGAKNPLNAAQTASQVADRVRVVGGGTEWIYTDQSGVATGGSFINTVEYVIAGGTSIDLRKLDIAWTAQTYWNYSNYYPIALDLDGDGLNLSAVDSSSVVVRTAQGGLSKIGWVGPTDGFLAVDRDGDGAINTLSEISFVQDKPGATSDLEGLRTWDTNGDGVLDKADKDFSRILLFVDANQNGRSTAKELRTLEQAGIAAINLGGTATGYTREMTTESFVQNTLSFVWADGRTGEGYDVALARRVLGSEGLYAGEYQAEWGARDEDGTLGQLLNDPKTAAKAARIKARKGLLDKLGATYAETKTAAQVDFSDNDRVDAAVAKRWKKMDASQQAAWLSGQGGGMEGYRNLARLRSMSAEQSRWAAQGRGAQAAQNLVTHGQDQAAARVLAAGPHAQAGVDGQPAQDAADLGFGAVSSLGGAVSGEPLGGVVLAGTAIGRDQAWWRGEMSQGVAGAGSLGALLAVMDQGENSPALDAAASAHDPSLLQQQALLRQAMAGFGGQTGGSAAIWNRDAAQASTVLAADGQARLPAATNLAMTS